MPNINITVQGQPVQEPTTPPSSAVSVQNNAGQSAVAVDLPQVVNDGNVTRTLRVTVTDLVNCTINRVGMTVGSNFTFQNNVNTFEGVLAPAKQATGHITFNVTPPSAGEPDEEATATYLYEWV